MDALQVMRLKYSKIFKNLIFCYQEILFLPANNQFWRWRLSQKLQILVLLGPFQTDLRLKMRLSKLCKEGLTWRFRCLRKGSESRSKSNLDQHIRIQLAGLRLKQSSRPAANVRVFGESNFQDVLRFCKLELANAGNPTQEHSFW